MKKWLAMLMALSMLLTLCGCKKTAPEKETTGYTKEESWDYDENRGYFLDENAAPQMSGEGLKADLYEAYYTKNGYLYVQVKIGNGTDRVQRVQSVDVALYDPETEEMIAGGVAELEEEVIVKIAEVIDYGIYISPEHVEWNDSEKLPSTLSFSISVDHVAVEIE